ncbi:hypothetical protein CENSYa_1099 [Cenarchaeum symbiosum A]|uniref:Uncharacterized protein n=1 Tax=Cenarchaeum symbiosum (strain A) TaxID=414004 RepID=A0RWL1_CENSY|nr:hypothetical protein CENSYa_1099 [Cenarchaeum symbiosum A]
MTRHFAASGAAMIESRHFRQGAHSISEWPCRPFKNHPSPSWRAASRICFLVPAAPAQKHDYRALARVSPLGLHAYSHYSPYS